VIRHHSLVEGEEAEEEGKSNRRATPL